jgi:hypothetical protein
MDHVRCARRGDDIAVITCPYNFYGEDDEKALRAKLGKLKIELIIPERSKWIGLLHPSCAPLIYIIPLAVAKAIDAGDVKL